jgi:D-proline reductase (dithiol) PrdB
VGLVQNQIERAGVATISMTVQPHITATVGAPRAVYLRYPAGNQVGEAGKPQQQRAILRAALDAITTLQTPGTIVEFPYRWRRFPIQEAPVYTGISHGARHPQIDAIGDALDTLVRLAQEYKAAMEARVAQEANSAVRLPGVDQALHDHVDRIQRFIDILDTEALDQLREIANRVTTLELRVSGKFV